MIIRNATEADIEFIVQEGIKFLEYHPANLGKNLDVPYLFNLALTLINEHIVLIAEEEENKLGMIGGMLSPAIYNPKYNVLVELFWWVKEEYRNTSASMRLLREFEVLGKRMNVSAINMTSTVYTPSLEKVYKKGGYKLMELAYIKEI